ncbi:MAG: hypothetical protein ACE5HI_08630, partial [bacterium]
MIQFKKFLILVVLYQFYISISFLDSTSFAQESRLQSQYEIVPPKVGERCLVCGVPLTKDDLVLIVRGRRVPLNQTMVDYFFNNKEKFFST